MRRSTIKKLTAFFMLSTIITISCKKEVEEERVTSPEYLKEFYGDFNFFSYKRVFSMGKIKYKDTLYYKGFIKESGASDSTIHIRYRPGKQTTTCGGDSVFGAHIQPILRPDGELRFERVKECSNQSGFNGNFTGKDTINFYVGSGGMGMNYRQIIHGVRIH